MKRSCSVICPALYLSLLLAISQAHAEPPRTAQVIIAKGNSLPEEVKLVRELLVAGLTEAGCMTKQPQSPELNPPTETLTAHLLVTVKLVNKPDAQDKHKKVHGLSMRTIEVATGKIISMALEEGLPFLPAQNKDRRAKLEPLVLKCRSKAFAKITPICDGRTQLTRRYTIISHNTPGSAKFKIRGILKDSCQSVRMRKIDEKKLEYVVNCQTDLANLQKDLDQGIRDRARRANIESISQTKNGLTLIFK